MIKSLLLKTIKGKPLTIWVEGQTRGLLEKFQIRTLPFNYIVIIGYLLYFYDFFSFTIILIIIGYLLCSYDICFSFTT
jgi:hypothetical protein